MSIVGVENSDVGLVAGLFVADVSDLFFGWYRENYINPIVENN